MSVFSCISLLLLGGSEDLP